MAIIYHTKGGLSGILGYTTEELPLPAMVSALIFPVVVIIVNKDENFVLRRNQCSQHFGERGSVALSPNTFLNGCWQYFPGITFFLYPCLGSLYIYMIHIMQSKLVDESILVACLFSCFDDRSRAFDNGF